MEEVHSLLGRPFQVPGIVVQGDKRDGQSVFQQQISNRWKDVFIPATGVYAVKFQCKTNCMMVFVM